MFRSSLKIFKSLSSSKSKLSALASTLNLEAKKLKNKHIKRVAKKSTFWMINKNF